MITIDQLINRESKIAIVVLGYVGLPLAAVFGHQADVLGFARRV